MVHIVELDEPHAALVKADLDSRHHAVIEEAPASSPSPPPLHAHLHSHARVFSPAALHPTRRLPSRGRHAYPHSYVDGPVVEDVSEVGGTPYNSGAQPITGRVDFFTPTSCRKHGHLEDEDASMGPMRKSPRMGSGSDSRLLRGMPPVFNLGASFDACINNFLGNLWGAASEMAPLAGASLSMAGLPGGGAMGFGQMAAQQATSASNMNPPTLASPPSPPQPLSPVPSMVDECDASDVGGFPLVAQQSPMMGEGASQLTASVTGGYFAGEPPAVGGVSHDCCFGGSDTGGVFAGARLGGMRSVEHELASQFVGAFVGALAQPDPGAVCSLLHPEAFVSIGGTQWRGPAEGGVALHSLYAGCLPDVRTVDASPMGGSCVLILVNGIMAPRNCGTFPLASQFAQHFALAPVAVDGLTTSFVITNTCWMPIPP